MMKPFSRLVIKGGLFILVALWAGLSLALPAGAQTEPPPTTAGPATTTPAEATAAPPTPAQTSGPTIITGPSPTSTLPTAATPSPTPAGSILTDVSGGILLLLIIGAVILLGGLILVFILFRLSRRRSAPPKVALRPAPVAPAAETPPPTVTTTPASAPKAYLALLSAPGGNFPLGQERMTIGRAAGNQILLPAGVTGRETVSRFHAAIYWQIESHIIEDLDSQNGILVNGQATSKNRLKDGDELSFGEVKLQYHRGEPAVQEEENQS